MHYASQELSKELYELTGLVDKESTCYWTIYGSLCFQPNWYDENILQDGEILPTYSLGYLLRKLPATLHPGGKWKWPVDFELSRPTPAINGKVQWKAAYKTIHRTYMYEWADTPENAACKLAIALAKANLIPKEGKTDATNS